MSKSRSSQFLTIVLGNPDQFSMFGVAMNSKVKTIQSDQFDEPNESDLNDEHIFAK